MIKKFLILFFLIGCTSKKINYPLRMVSMDNYNSLNFNYIKIKDIQYNYCDSAVALPVNSSTTIPIGSSNKYDINTIIDDSLIKYKTDNILQKNQYLINIEINRFSKFRYFILYAKICDTVTMELVERVDE